MDSAARDPDFRSDRRLTEWLLGARKLLMGTPSFSLLDDFSECHASVVRQFHLAWISKRLVT
jgi:hypothetical protein